jgi:formylglycine-generating enzyme required for sulfatase activity
MKASTIRRCSLAGAGAVVGLLMAASAPPALATPATSATPVTSATPAGPAMPAVAEPSAGDASYASIVGGSFQSILPSGGKERVGVRVGPFSLQRTPVTNREFLAFVREHPEWQKGKVPGTLADGRYLQHWQGPLELGAQALPPQPVTNVSWFAARAFCEVRHARLPDWYEWEYAAAADAHVPDARRDPQWQQRVLAWYGKPSNRPLTEVGRSEANLYGVYDLHGLVWEWVEDFNALFIGADNRNQGDPDALKYCGSGALSVEDRENYPVMMRLAMLSSLRGNSTTANVGFRCAQPQAESYHVGIPLETQDGKRIAFEAGSAHLRIVTMFYTSCPMACPLTIDTLRSIERGLTPAERARLEVLMVTFDPAHDSPAVLKRVTVERHLDTSRWTLARTTAGDVRRLSARLDIPYRALPDGRFNHASVLILMDGAGHELARTNKTGLPDPQFIAAVRRSLEAPAPAVARRAEISMHHQDR